MHYPSSRWRPSQRCPCEGQAPNQLTLWIASSPYPHISGFLRWPLLPAIFIIKLSLWYMTMDTPQTQLLWSHKTTNSLQVQKWCAQAPSAKSDANLTKHYT